MKVAVAKRPVEAFETAVTLPEFMIEPDDEAYGLPDDGFVTPDGMPVEGAAESPADPEDGFEPQAPPPAAARPAPSLGSDFLRGVEPQRPRQP